MAKKINEEKLTSIVKKIAIGLVVLAVLVFMLMSVQIFNMSASDPSRYQDNYRKLTSNEKSMVKSMKKTGEVQSKIMGTRRATGGNGKFIEEVERNHAKDQKKN
ncbi:MAG: hypothetical protein IKO39_10930 [Treponema sp.]|nr:hypothetical protein [Treponema sp.]